MKLDINNSFKILEEFQEKEVQPGLKIKDLDLQMLELITFRLEGQITDEFPTYLDKEGNVLTDESACKKQQKKLEELYCKFRAYTRLKSLEHEIHCANL